MNKEFVNYEQALTLKELGFDEHCIGWYNPQVNYKEVTTDKYWAYHLTGDWKNFRPAPLYQQVFRWFEDNQSMFIERIVTTNANEIVDIEYNIKSWRFPTITIEFDDSYDSFDKNKAELACLIKLIEIVKEKDKC